MEYDNTIQSGLDEALQAHQTIREALAGKAQELVQLYWDGHYANNPKNKINNKSVMGVRLHWRDKDACKFNIEWYWNDWVRTRKGQWKPLSHGITKPRSKHQYTSSALTRHAKEWEVDHVLNLEKDFAGIRKKLFALSRSELALRRLQRMNGQQDGEPERQ